MWKRISAFLFDGIVLGIVAVLFAWLLSAALGYDGYSAALDQYYAQYEAEYGVSFQMTLDEYEAMTEDEAKNLEAAYAALAENEEAAYAYEMLIRLTLLITTGGILMGFLLMEFFVPLLLKNGQTLGKKVFGIGLMRAEGVKIPPVALFIRAILGGYTLETMIPVYLALMIYFNGIGLIGTIILLLILLLELILPLVTRNHTPIHDLLAGTVAIDLSSQRIFDTQEELIAYKEKAHAEAVARQAY